MYAIRSYYGASKAPAAPAATPAAPAPAAPTGGVTIPAPVAGTLLKHVVAAGSQVSGGQTIMIIESMKRNNFV